MDSSLDEVFGTISLDEVEEQTDDENEVNTEETQWQHLPLNQFGQLSLSMTPVDGQLLSVAKQEIKELCRNATKLLHKTKSSDISTSDSVNYFLDAISDRFIFAVHQGMPSTEELDGNDIVGFIRVLIFLSVYGVTPTTFFDSCNASIFPHASTLPKNTFVKLMKALKGSISVPSSSGTWEEPFHPDDCIRDMELAFSSASAKIALIPRCTIISIDDDQYRLQSVLTEALGFARVNNPKKAFGPVSTNAVSVVTSMVLSMRLLGRGENYQDVVKILMMWMHNKSLPEHVQGKHLLALDRGYLNQALTEFLLGQGFDLIGTHKRTKWYPFTFGDIAATGNRT